MEAYKKTKGKIINWFRENGFTLAASLTFGLIVYWLMISQNLVNDLDGLWHTSNYVAGSWEISLGRFMLRYVDKLYDGVLAAPVTAAITIFLFSLGNIIAFHMLQIRQRGFRLLLSFFMLASPFMCHTLSYAYTSVGYGVAYLFAVFAAASCFYFHCIWGILACGICIAFSMSCYQAYIDIFCVLVLLALIKMIQKQKDVRSLAAFLGRGLFGGVLGGIFYFISARLMLLYAGGSLASYKGAGTVSIGQMLRSLPSSIVNCYQCFYEFLVEKAMYINKGAYEVTLRVVLVLLAAGVVYVCVKIFHTSIMYGVAFIVCILVFPMAANAVLLLAPGNSATLLMSMGSMYIVVLPVMLLPENGTFDFCLRRVCFLAVSSLLWVSILTVENDQLALSEGRTAAVTLAQNIIGELREKGYLGNDYAIALVGRPANNDLFRGDTAFYTANAYAQFGYWSTQSGNNRASWEGLITQYCGVRINLCYEETYDIIRLMDEVENMPEFPAEGSVQEIEGVIVVKVSELY